MKEIGLYIHIPFCKAKCKYCDFNSYAGLDNFQHSYLLALIKEIKSYKSKLKDYNIDTIFIGGGTPSVLFQGAISTILSEIKANFNVLPNAEITIEANPNSITYSKALEWVQAGINRVSVGLQSIKTSCLKKIGRIHTKQDYVNAIETLKSVGVRNINTDIMLGLPGQKLSDLRKTINLAVKIGSTHISVYALILESGTKLFEEVANGIIKLPSEEKVVNMLLNSEKYLMQYGFNRYEISNYALKGYECKHNLNCWNMHNYIGVGAGAHSFFEDTRWNNKCGVCEYINAIESCDCARENIEKESNDELLEETIMLGLRTLKGIDIKSVDSRFKINFLSLKKDQIKKLKDLGFIEVVDGYIRATKTGLLFLNKAIEMLT